MAPRGRPRKNIITNEQPIVDAVTETRAQEATVSVETVSPTPTGRFLPYLGADQLPNPPIGKIHGEARFFVNNNTELIMIRKKRLQSKKIEKEIVFVDGKEVVVEKEIRAEGLVVQREMFMNLNTKRAKASGIRAELKKCGIPGLM